MPEETKYHELRCSVCDWSQLCGLGLMRDWLRKVGKVRPTSDMEPVILVEMFRSSASEFECPECGQRGLAVAEESEDDWPDAITCEACSGPIPDERLKAIPGTTLCAACQGKDERGIDIAEQEYCPRCGSLMTLRMSNSSGIARYVSVCTGTPPCRSGRRI